MNGTVDKTKDFDLIAWKERSLIWRYFLTLIFFAVGAVGFVFVEILIIKNTPSDFFDWFYVVLLPVGELVAIFLIGRMIYSIVDYYRSPLVYIVYQDGKLFFEREGMVYTPSKISEVYFQNYGTSFRTRAWGYLEIKVGEKKISYRSVAKVQEASERLLALKEQKEQNND